MTRNISRRQIRKEQPRTKNFCLQGRAVQAKALAYQVPADFDVSLLGKVDTSSADAAEMSMTNAFWLRWMHLRNEASSQQPAT